jgi:hypothetical protein
MRKECNRMLLTIEIIVNCYNSPVSIIGIHLNIPIPFYISYLHNRFLPRKSRVDRIQTRAQPYADPLHQTSRVTSTLANTSALLVSLATNHISVLGVSRLAQGVMPCDSTHDVRGS